VETLLHWYSDPEVIHWLHASDRPAMTRDDVRTRFGPAAGEKSQVRWMIDAADGETIGLIRLIDIDRDTGRAELTIVIGKTAYWGEGYGTAAMRLVLGHAFEALGLRRVYLITDADNDRGIRSYEKCGFRREGVLRAHRTRYGEPLDMLIMGVLQKEWLDERRD
jgi:RimJ/RimL family protein N-acetyltransferase